jgi:hypothetical protein
MKSAITKQAGFNKMTHIINFLQGGETQYDRNLAFCNYLMRRDKEEFVHFVDSLVIKGEKKIARKLAERLWRKLHPSCHQYCRSFVPQCPQLGVPTPNKVHFTVVAIIQRNYFSFIRVMSSVGFGQWFSELVFFAMYGQLFYPVPWVALNVPKQNC